MTTGAGRGLFEDVMLTLGDDLGGGEVVQAAAAAGTELAHRAVDAQGVTDRDRGGGAGEDEDPLAGGQVGVSDRILHPEAGVGAGRDDARHSVDRSAGQG